jgi:hypothetical protein
MIWFFSLKMDAVVGPWLKENAMTISFVLGLPYLAYRWWWKNLERIRALKEKDDDQG